MSNTLNLASEEVFSEKMNGLIEAVSSGGGGGGGADPSVLEKVITAFPSGTTASLRITAVGEKATDRYYNHRFTLDVVATQPAPTDPTPAKWFLGYVTTGYLPGAMQSTAAAGIVVNTPGRPNQVSGTFAVASNVYDAIAHTTKITGLQYSSPSGQELRVKITHCDGLDISQWMVEAVTP